MLMKVVLPAPFGPMMQRSSLLASWKSTWSVATRPETAWSASVRKSSAMLNPGAAREQAGDGAGDTASQIDDHQHEEDAKRQLPAARPRSGSWKGSHEDTAEQCAEQRGATADPTPDHHFGREEHTASDGATKLAWVPYRAPARHAIAPESAKAAVL